MFYFCWTLIENKLFLSFFPLTILILKVTGTYEYIFLRPSVSLTRKPSGRYHPLKSLRLKRENGFSYG